MIYDVLIIGAGITGCSVSMELSRYSIRTVVLERANDVAMGTTKANSGIIHAGYDPVPGTAMARLNVEGNRMVHELAREMNFHFKETGSLVVGGTPEEHSAIDRLYERGQANGVPGMRIIGTAEELHGMEPNLSPDLDYALYAPTAGVVLPWEMCLAFANTAAANGVEFCLNSPVTGIRRDDDAFSVTSGDRTWRARYVINAAGLFADEVYRMAAGADAPSLFTIVPCKGEYYLLDKDQGDVVSTVVFQTPTALGKGVLVSPTVHGNLIVGPDANYDTEGKSDVSTTSRALEFIRRASARTTDRVSFSANIRNFAGERATVPSMSDFIIGQSPDVPGFINFAGIKSPGLASAAAFGPEAARILSEGGLALERKDDFAYFRLPGCFADMTVDEKKEAIRRDPAFGRVICRCETVTEGEIRAAMDQPIPARTVDGVKRRTNAGLGRCQGGFCGPKIFQLLRDRWGLAYDEVFQDQEGSNICVGVTKGSGGGSKGGGSV